MNTIEINELEIQLNSYLEVWAKYFLIAAIIARKENGRGNTPGYRETMRRVLRADTIEVIG